MIVSITPVGRRDHGMWIEIDPADERRFFGCASIDEPALLMLAKAWMSAVPADFHAGSAAVEQCDMGRRPPECVVPEPRCLFIWSPENDSHIDSPRSRTIKDIKWGSAAARHLACLPHESDRYTLHHYRDKDQDEVDIIVEDEHGALIGIEVKASATVHASDFKGMRKLLDTCGDGLKLGLVLYDGTKVFPFGDASSPLLCLAYGLDSLHAMETRKR